MAGIARDRSVSADQRKAVQVILHGSRGRAPALNRVAVLALSAELSPVEIRMASRALRPGLGKNVRDVARFTGHVLMHPAQRKLSSVVIKLGLRAQRREARGGVTVLARDRNRPVRIPRRLRLDGWHQPQSERQQRRNPCATLPRSTGHCQICSPTPVATPVFLHQRSAARR